MNVWTPLLNTTQAKILMAVHDNGKITKPELSDITGQGKTSVDNYIAQLKSLGILSRVGSRKAGQWVLSRIPPPANGG